MEWGVFIMNPIENYLEAVNFGSPDYIPRKNEDIFCKIELENNFKFENWVDLWGVEWEITVEDSVPFPVKNPITSLKQLEDFNIPSPDKLIFNDEMKDIVETSRKTGKLLRGHLTYFMFERAWALTGLEKFFIGMIENPEAIHYLLDQILEYNLKVFERYIDLGVDMIAFSEDLGSQKALMMSPTMFREFFLPRYKKCFKPLLKEDIMINFHSCGCVDAIIEDIVETGATILNPIQARANDLDKIRKITQDKMCLMGGIDTQYTLTRGTPEEVKEEVLIRMRQLGDKGGYIVAPDQSIEMPEKNIKAFYETAEMYGKYPDLGR